MSYRFLLIATILFVSIKIDMNHIGREKNVNHTIMDTNQLFICNFQQRLNAINVH